MGNTQNYFPIEGENENINVKLGQKFNFFLYSNTSARECFKITNFEELKEYLDLVKLKSKYLGLRGETGSNTEHIYTFKAKKIGNIQMKIYFYSAFDEKVSDSDDDFIDYNSIYEVHDKDGNMIGTIKGEEIKKNDDDKKKEKKDIFNCLYNITILE